MSATATPPLVVPAAKDVPPPPPPSVESRIAAAFNTPPPPPMPKAPTPPPNPATSLPKADVAPEVKPEPPKADAPSKIAPTLLPKKSAVIPPAPAAEPDPFEKFNLPETAPEEQRSQFTELKRISRDQHKKIKELEARATSAVATPELEKLRTEHKVALDRLAVLDLQSHPLHKQQYTVPIEKALSEVAEILTYNGKEEVNLRDLLFLEKKALNARVNELTKDMNNMDATSVLTALRTAQRLSMEEKKVLANSGELNTRIAQQSEAQARQTFEEVSSNLGPLGEILVPLDVPEGSTAEEKSEIEDYNRSVSGIRQNVEQTVFGKTNEKGMAILGWKAGTLDFLLSKGIPRMEKNYAALVQSHNALAAELAAIKGSKGSGPIAGDPAKGTGKAATNEELVAAAFGKK